MSIPAALETSAVRWQHRRCGRVSSDASSLLGQVQRLRVAGAERLSCPNLPAFGLTPATVSSTSAGGDQRQPTLAAIPSSAKLAAIGATQQVLSSAATPTRPASKRYAAKRSMPPKACWGLPANTLVRPIRGAAMACKAA